MYMILSAVEYHRCHNTKHQHIVQLQFKECINQINRFNPRGETKQTKFSANLELSLLLYFIYIIETPSGFI